MSLLQIVAQASSRITLERNELQVLLQKAERYFISIGGSLEGSRRYRDDMSDDEIVSISSSEDEE